MQPEQHPQYRHADNVSWRRVGDQVLIIQIPTSAYFSLNGVGALVWEKLGAGDDAVRVREAVCREYDAEPAAVERDVAKLIGKLTKAQLLLAR